MFDEFIGYQDIKDELQQLIDVMENTVVYQHLGASIPRALLLWGPPGVGKTLMAKSLIKAAGRTSFVLRKDEPNDMFIKKIHDTFARAKEEAPSIILLDDMDKFADAGDVFDCDKEAYVSIQSAMEEMIDEDVFVVATANSTYSFPRSLLRPGRFDRVLEVKPPEGEDAKAIISHFIKGKPFSPDINLDAIVKVMQERSCADLEAITKEAARIAAKERANAISMDHFVQATMQVNFNVISFTAHPEMEDFEQILCHEAGHAVVSEILAPGSVSIVSTLGIDGEKGGFCAFYKDPHISDYDWRVSRAICALGGRAACEQVFNKPGTGSAGDLDSAFQITRHLIVDDCINNDFLLHDAGNDSSPMLRAKVEESTAVEIGRFYREAKQIIADNLAFLQALVNALHEKPYLTSLDVTKIRARVRLAA